MRKVLTDKPVAIDTRKILGPTRDAAAEVIREKNLFVGSSGKI